MPFHDSGLERHGIIFLHPVPPVTPLPRSLSSVVAPVTQVSLNEVAKDLPDSRYGQAPALIRVIRIGCASVCDEHASIVGDYLLVVALQHCIGHRLAVDEHQFDRSVSLVGSRLSSADASE